MIEESLRYLRSSEDWIKTVLIGGLLTIFGFLLVPLFIVVGYYVRVLRGTMHDESEPPVFDDWGEMLMEGLKGFAIYVVYGLVPGIIGAIIAFVGIGGAIAGDSGAAGVLGGLVALVGFLVALALGLLAAYIVPAALANFVEKDDLMAGFAFGEIRAVITTKAYAMGWLTAFALLLGAGILTSVLSIVPVIGTVIGIFVTFYAAVAAFYVIGHTWADVHPVDLHEEEEMPGQQPAI
ncbi:DUF4013 domain-containing protein [Salinigranum halophilum]|jgi:hypothetical protein|uniref:DUF4013 domain-containing protein n=1 Tax=Salinigranum halophilum TaxID=2565931 RepID=UPI0010A938B7|nr:DUF4013 domain-containing protein [Salinigranum halophilum]